MCNKNILNSATTAVVFLKKSARLNLQVNFIENVTDYNNQLLHHIGNWQITRK